MLSLCDKYLNDCSSVFSLKLWITNYFDSVINKIDIFTENLIVECESNANVKKRCDLNSTRDKIINEIKTIEEANLKELEINREYVRIQIEILRLNHKHEDLVNQISKVLFKNFCIFISNKEVNVKLSSSYPLGILIVTDWFMTDADILFLKYIFGLAFVFVI